MKKTKYIWMDGEKVPWDEAKVHSLTHTFHYGAGAFEGIRFYETDKGPAIFRLPEHVDRLFYSAKVIGMRPPYSAEEIFQAIIETVKENQVNAGYIRPMFYYGYGKMGLNPKDCLVNAMVACWPWGAYLAGDQPIDIQISKYIRIHPQSTVADAKINGHYVNSILASLEMNEAGKDEALFLDFEGKVAEGPGENIFMVKDGKLFTPKLGTILGGITRATVMEIAQDLGIEVQEQDLWPDDLYNADELFFTGTAAEVSPIGSIDDKVINNGEVGGVTKKIRSLYMDIVHGRHEKYQQWLTYIN